MIRHCSWVSRFQVSGDGQTVFKRTWRGVRQRLVQFGEVCMKFVCFEAMRQMVSNWNSDGPMEYLLTRKRKPCC